MKPAVVVILPVGIVILLLLFGSFNWLQGPLINAIDIRLIDEQQETQDKGIARLLGGRHPDYQVVFVVSGRKIATNTLGNSTARTWLSLRPETAFKATDLEQIRIINKQVLEDEILEIIDKPGPQGRGEYYEYRLNEERAVF